MKRTALALFLLLVLGSVLSLGTFAAGQQDQLGTVKASSTSCPEGGLRATSCYALDISCPKIPDYTAYVKVITPFPHSYGTVIFTIGGSIDNIYESYLYGTVAVQDVLDARLTAVELTFGAPFAKAPGWEHEAGGEGVRAASCRYATAVQWIAENQTAADAPLCATGSSAGGQNIAEGLAHYGLGKYLTFAEITSGPPFNRTDYACIDTVPPAVSYCSGVDVSMAVAMGNAIKFVDPAYPGPWCSSSLKTHSNQYAQEFLRDSVTSPDATLSYPNTKVRFLFGGKDVSGSIRQGLAYQSQISQRTTYGCVSDAPHSIPDVLDGAQAIGADLVNNCHK